RHLHVFFEPPQTSAIYTLSLHDALPISVQVDTAVGVGAVLGNLVAAFTVDHHAAAGVDHAHNGVAGNWAATVGEGNHQPFGTLRSEEHTSELQSRENLVCRLLLEKKNTK